MHEDWKIAPQRLLSLVIKLSNENIILVKIAKSHNEMRIEKKKKNGGKTMKKIDFLMGKINL